MKRLSGKAILSSLVFLGLLGCTPDTPKLVGEPPGERKISGGSTQESEAVVDILFVIDDSYSMDRHQANLSTNIYQFIDQLQQNQKLDFHLGVITTCDDYFCPGMGGVLRGNVRVVTRQTPNLVDVLSRNLLVGTDGSGDEQVFSPVQKALTEPLLSGANFGFSRPDAYLALVVLTDGDDHSKTIFPQSFYNFLVDLKGRNPDKILTYSAYIPAMSGSCYTEEDPSYRLTEFFGIAKAVTFNLCDPQFGKKLADIGKDLVRKVGKKVLLDSRPVQGTIHVVYGTQIIPQDDELGWIYNLDDNSISFGPKLVWSQQPDGTQIEVTYTAEK